MLDFDTPYKEILKLDFMLNEAKIPHTFDRIFDGFQICYPVRELEGNRVRIMDAVEFFGSYGKETDLLEIMGLLTQEEEENDFVAGYLTAKEVFDRIEKHWNLTNL